MSEALEPAHEEAAQAEWQWWSLVVTTLTWSSGGTVLAASAPKKGARGEAASAIPALKYGRAVRARLPGKVRPLEKTTGLRTD
jgi:hypothetical protein